MKWYFIVVSICITLISNIDHLFHVLLAICISSLEKCLFRSFAHSLFPIVVQSLSCVRLFATPWIAAHQASLSFTISWSLLKLMSMMPSNHLILCHPLLLLPSILLGIRVFFNKLVLHIRAQSIGSSASSSVLPMNIQDWFPLGLAGLISLQSKGLSRVFSNTTVGKHQLFRAQHFCGQNLTSVHDYWKNHSFD